MELAIVFTEPVLRRCWLLNKALENASLDEALRVAWAADEFLGTGRAGAQAPENGQALREWLSGGLSTVPSQGSQFAPRFAITASPRDRADEGWVSPLAEQGAGHVPAADRIEGPPDGFKNVGAAGNDIQEAVSGRSGDEDAGDEPVDDEPQNAMISALAVLADMDDIVRFLRQQDDVVVSAGTGAYLVNGRFQLNCEELLARANKIRQRRGKPQFQRIPAGFPTANGGGAAERAQDRT